MPSRGHHFLVTVQSINDAGEAAGSELKFRHTNHDDIIAVALRVRERSGLAPEVAAATAIGLKLLSEAMLSADQDLMFDPLKVPIRSFIQALKARVASGPR